MKKVIWVCLPLLSTVPVGLLLAAPAVVSSTFNAAVQEEPAGPAPALASIPARMLGLYGSAAATCPGLGWTILAAVGTVESGNGTSDAPGVHTGHNGAGAEGPMQFLPRTFARYALPVPTGGARPPSPYDPTDAIYAAARMLCADGAGSTSGLGAALYDYNHSDAYVARVLDVAATFGWSGTPDGGLAARAVAYAVSQVGTPYRWGGETPGVGFDCSGLVQAAWGSVGVALPRVAQDQFDAGPLVPPGDPLAVGDLVFFGDPPATATHVGLVVQPSGLMVDAPHTGAAVRIETFPIVIGQRWGGEIYLGATNPGS